MDIFHILSVLLCFIVSHNQRVTGLAAISAATVLPVCVNAFVM
jgi:hypothetical protein